MSRLNKKIFSFGLIVLVLVGVFFVAQLAAAANTAEGEKSATTVIGSFANKGISMAVGFIVKWILTPIIQVITRVFAKLIEFAIEMNSQLFASDSFIIKVWAKVRDIANLGFVLMIVAIAFATILRIEAYGVKKTLAKLIIVALLVNFSLMICAALFDLANIFSQPFLTAITKNQTIGDALYHSGNIGGKQVSTASGEQKSFRNLDADDVVSGSKSTLGGVATSLFMPIFIVIFAIILIIVLAAIFVMLLIRYVVLAMLVILSPLAWLCAILPATQTQWKQWWGHFVRWILFLPIMLFFVWLAVYAAENISFSGGGAFAAIGNFVVVLGLLLGGLIVANSFSITGADKAMGLAKAGAVGVGAFIGTKAGGRVLQTGWAQRMAGGLQKAGSGKGGAGRLFGAPVRLAGARLAGTQRRFGVGFVEQAEKRFENLSTDDLIRFTRTGASEERVASFNILAKKGNLSKLSSNELQTIQRTATRFGKAKEVEGAIEKQVPHLSQKVMKPLSEGKINEAQRQLEELISKISPKDLQNADLAHMIKNLNTRQIGVQATLNLSNKNIDLLNSVYKNASHKDKLEIHDALKKEIALNRAKYQPFRERASKSKNLLINELAAA